MLTFKNFVIREGNGKSAVLTFGRFNPMTIGHEKLVDFIVATAKSKKAEPILFTSQTQDKKKNPLSFKDKTKYLTKFFPSVKVSTDTKIRTIFDALGYLSKQGQSVSCD